MLIMIVFNKIIEKSLKTYKIQTQRETHLKNKKRKDRYYEINDDRHAFISEQKH